MKIKKIICLLSLMFIVVLFYSCDDEENKKKDAYGDVMVKSVIKGDSVVYGIYYYTYSWDQMEKVTVRREEQDKTILLDSLNYRYTFAHNPTDAELTLSPPQKGKFIFDVTFEGGEEYTTTDYLDSTFLSPPVIEELTFDVNDEQLKIDWKENKLANTYKILLIDSKDEIAYESDALNPNQTFLWITASTIGWITNKKPGGGEKYKVAIAAYQFEKVASNFDVQSISWNDTSSFVWRIIELE